jgi:hypothetical protein
VSNQKEDEEGDRVSRVEKKILPIPDLALFYCPIFAFASIMVPTKALNKKNFQGSNLMNKAKIQIHNTPHLLLPIVLGSSSSVIPLFFILIEKFALSKPWTVFFLILSQSSQFVSLLGPLFVLKWPKFTRRKMHLGIVILYLSLAFITILQLLQFLNPIWGRKLKMWSLPATIIYITISSFVNSSLFCLAIEWFLQDSDGHSSPLVHESTEAFLFTVDASRLVSYLIFFLLRTCESEIYVLLFLLALSMLWIGLSCFIYMRIPSEKYLRHYSIQKTVCSFDRSSIATMIVTSVLSVFSSYLPIVIGHTIKNPKDRDNFVSQAFVILYLVQLCVRWWRDSYVKSDIFENGVKRAQLFASIVLLFAISAYYLQYILREPLVSSSFFIFYAIGEAMVRFLDLALFMFLHEKYSKNEIETTYESIVMGCSLVKYSSGAITGYVIWILFHFFDDWTVFALLSPVITAVFIQITVVFQESYYRQTVH